MTFTIEFKQSIEKDLAVIPKENTKKILEKIQTLANNPRPNGCKKIKGSENEYRIRINDYRVIYSILDKKLIIEIIKIGHRKNVYQ